jgi:hypothetical protein
MADLSLQKDSDSAPEKPAEKGSVDSTKKKTNLDKDVSFGKDIKIHTDKPLPQFDKGTIKAFRATGSNKIAKDLIAYICNKNLTPRLTTSIKYTKVKQQSLVKLVKSGKVFWPQVEGERFCFAYENTLGQAIADIKNPSPTLGWKPEDVIVNVAYPLINVLTNMRNMDIVHGEIWAGNMHFNGVAGADKVTLGECLSAPTSYHMPMLYEPIERALANPVARGTGSLADDLYSFGVSLAIILRTHDPMQGKSDKEIIEHKIEKGSYATLLSKDRLNGAILELLRGLLYDDPEQRWTLEDLESWMDGRRLSPKQSPKRVKASRPLILNDVKYIRPELLAKDMTNHADEMMRIVERGDLNLWIERAVEDKTVKVRTEQVLEEIEGYDRTEGYNERACATIAAALYPDLPIHYRAIWFNPTGFGRALTHAYTTKKDLQDYIDVMQSMFVSSCIRLQKITSAGNVIAKFDACRNFLNQTTLHSGLERCLYYMDPEAPCFSPIIEKYYVRSPEELLLALESVCAEGNPKILIDRHIASFLSVKDRRNIDPYIGDLTSSDRYKRILGLIRTLATIQKRSRLEKCPALAGWISKNLEDVYDHFHDAKKKESIQKQIEKIKKTGELTKIALFFDDPKLFQSDVGSFYQAMQEYTHLNDEKKKIIDKLENKKNYGQRSGQQVASVVSMAVAFCIMIVSAYIMVIKG